MAADLAGILELSWLDSVVSLLQAIFSYKILASGNKRGKRKLDTKVFKLYKYFYSKCHYLFSKKTSYLPLYRIWDGTRILQNP